MDTIIQPDLQPDLPVARVELVDTLPLIHNSERRDLIS